MARHTKDGSSEETGTPAGIQIKGESGTPDIAVPSVLSSLLDPLAPNLQTTSHLISEPYPKPRDDYRIQPSSEAEAEFRHSGWSANRNRVFLGLLRTGQSTSRLDKFAQCGSSCWLYQHNDTGNVKLRANYCHDKFCVPCSLAQARFVACQLEEHCKGKSVRFLTITLKHSNTPLKDQIDRLYRSFTELRRRVFWKDAVTGGAAFLEVKLNEESGMWHPHFHILIEGKWMDVYQLCKEWHGVTGDSWMCHIQAIRDPEEQFSYVAKYAGKPVDNGVIKHEEKLYEAINAMRGRRCCFTFGSWRGVELKPHATPDAGWVCVGSLDSLCADALAGDAAATRLLQALKRRNRPSPGTALAAPP